MLPAEKKQQGLNMIPRHEPFEVLYRLNCDNLCADFTEDIEFRFSFGITSLIQRFMGKGKPNPFVMKNYTESVRWSRHLFSDSLALFQQLPRKKKFSRFFGVNSRLVDIQTKQEIIITL